VSLYDYGNCLQLCVNKTREPLHLSDYHIVTSATSLMEMCVCVWQCVTADSFIPCLVDLCKALWGIMNSYHQVVSWHQRKDSQKLPAGEAVMMFLLIQPDTFSNNVCV
jgi:hypothetical protein